MTETPPDWAILPNAEYRNIPGEFKGGRGGQIDWKLIKLQGDLFINTFIGRVAIAFGGINIFGWKPLEFLAEWGQKRIEDAQSAYNAAISAQNSANYANIQLSLLTSGQVASSVSGGVSVSDQFTGSSSNDLGSSWTRTSFGPGGGNFGRNGSGRAVWKKFGGLWRRHQDIYTTPLATDYQMIVCIMGGVPQSPSAGANAYNYLLARVSSSGSNGIFARVTNNEIAVGDFSSSTISVWETASVTPAPGDQWVFIVGTADNDRQVIVKQNATPRLVHTNSTHSYGEGYRNVGMAAQAGDRSLFLNQTVPGEIDVWSAADRNKTYV